MGKIRFLFFEIIAPIFALLFILFLFLSIPTIFFTFVASFIWDGLWKYVIIEICIFIVYLVIFIVCSNKTTSTAKKCLECGGEVSANCEVIMTKDNSFTGDANEYAYETTYTCQKCGNEWKEEEPRNW